MYELCGTFLGGVAEEKYLGVLISHDLSWSPNITKLATTADQKLGFLTRNLRGCPKDLRKTACVTVVRSSLDYASTVWDPHLTKDKLALEKIQRQAARWITGNYQRYAIVTSMLGSLGLEPLEERRRVARLVPLYKILHEEVAFPSEELGLYKNPRATRGLATTDKLLVPSRKTTERGTHFVAKTIPEWNRLLEITTSTRPDRPNSSIRSPGHKFQPVRSSTPNAKTNITVTEGTFGNDIEHDPHTNLSHSTINLSENPSTTPPLQPKPMKENLRILNTNCQSIVNKSSELKANIETLQPDIICGTESLLEGIKPGKNPTQNAIKSSEIFPPHYNVYRNDRNRDGGGVFILIHKDLISLEEPEFVTLCEIDWARIKIKGAKDLFISCFYMPHRNISDLIELEKSLDLVNKKENRHMIILDDFNCPDVD